MISLSKNKAKVLKMGDEESPRHYNMKKWSTVTTILEGKKLGLVIAQPFAMIMDLLQAKENESSLSELVEENNFVFTGAVTQLAGALTDDHFMELVDKLLTGLTHEGEPIEDWSAHFDEYPEDFEQVILWSLKENLYDFFMKSPTLRSKLETLRTIVKPLAEKAVKGLTDGGNSE
jgi:hypothetical protein